MDWSDVKAIPGWMSDTDLCVLSNLSSYVPDNGHILEIGSFLGRSTSALYLSKKQTVSLTVVDEFKVNGMYGDSLTLPRQGNSSIFKVAKKLAVTAGSWRAGFEYCLGKDISDQITVNEMSSNDFVVDKIYDLVFIDGDHRCEQVQRDIIKCINDTTLIIGDDFEPRHIGVIQGLLPFITDSKISSGRSLFVPSNSKIWMLIPNNGYWNKCLYQALSKIERID